MGASIAICVSIAAFIVSFWFPLLAWGIILIADAVILLTLLSMKNKKWKHIPELSEDANKMFKKFGHYYAMPAAGDNFSAASSGFQMAGIAIGIVCGFKSIWWGIGLAIINYVVMAFAARGFNPTNFIFDEERNAHNEIILFLQGQRRNS